MKTCVLLNAKGQCSDALTSVHVMPSAKTVVKDAKVGLAKMLVKNQNSITIVTIVWKASSKNWRRV